MAKKSIITKIDSNKLLKINSAEIMQFAKGWYDKYFDENSFLENSDRIIKLKIIHGFLCGYNPAYISYDNLIPSISRMWWDYCKGQHAFTKLMEFSSEAFFLKYNAFYIKDIQKMLLGKMLDDIANVTIAERNSLGILTQIIYLGKPNRKLIKYIKEWRANL